MAPLPGPAALDAGLDLIEHVQIVLRIIRTRHYYEAVYWTKLFLSTLSAPIHSDSSRFIQIHSDSSPLT